MKKKSKPIPQIDPFIEYLCKNMDDWNRNYWSAAAKKRGITLPEMVKLYIKSDFGIKDKQ